MFKLFYFVCLPVLLSLADHARCESDYYFNLEAGGWLKLYTAPRAWEEALLKCDHDGAVLASPLNKELAHALQLQMLQFGVRGKVFLGTHDLFSKGHFVSVEGVPLFDMDIKWAQGDGVGTGDCLTMSVDGSVHFSSCTDPLPFICYRKPVNQTVNECNTYDNDYHYNEQTGNCYKIHHNKQTWSRAYSICASEGGHLVILDNAEKARIVQDLIRPSLPSTDAPNPTNGFYIGLVAWGKNRSWSTIHGERIEKVYNKWLKGEPNNAGNENEIRAMCYPNGKLNDHPKEKYPNKFICEKSPQY
ncbi:hypothetical protein PYW08_016223 [Mythimna loreyi]|uniref:Uncharacterized protein n=1 Tax=Mythimna loreyi TaxID=667449 RepID=A0ACC2QZ39_9NEOP|nr:hypothetical protein PYW08_016223 [Mythimna loreyi]